MVINANAILNNGVILIIQGLKFKQAPLKPLSI